MRDQAKLRDIKDYNNADAIRTTAEILRNMTGDHVRRSSDLYNSYASVPIIDRCWSILVPTQHLKMVRPTQPEAGITDLYASIATRKTFFSYSDYKEEGMKDNAPQEEEGGSQDMEDMEGMEDMDGIEDGTQEEEGSDTGSQDSFKLMRRDAYRRYGSDAYPPHPPQSPWPNYQGNLTSSRVNGLRRQ